MHAWSDLTTPTPIADIQSLRRDAVAKWGPDYGRYTVAPSAVDWFTRMFEAWRESQKNDARMRRHAAKRKRRRSIQRRGGRQR